MKITIELTKDEAENILYSLDAAENFSGQAFDNDVYELIDKITEELKNEQRND